MAGYWAGAGSQENCDRNGGLDVKIGGDADMPIGHGCNRERQAKEDWIRAVALLRL